MQLGISALLHGVVGTCFAAPAEQAKTGAQVYAQGVQDTPGLLAYWRMEGDLQDAKGQFHGVVQGEENFVTGALGGRALSLAAPDTWAEIDKAPALDLNAGSISLFFRFPEQIEGNPCLIAKRTPEQSARFSIHLMGDRKGIGLWNSANLGIAEIPGEPLAPNRWYHLVVVYAPGKSPQVYLDGAPTLTASHGGSFNRAHQRLPLLLGAATVLGMERFNGALDEVAIHDRPLDGERIAQWADAAGLQSARKARLAAYENEAAAQAEARIARHERNQARIRERMQDPALLAEGKTRDYRDAHREAISFPVGGIGTGPIQFNGDAVPHAWQIFNNFNYVHVPHSFLALSASDDQGHTVTRALQTEAMGPFAPMADLCFHGEYPFALYRFEDEVLPVRVSLELYNPLTPLHTRDSAIPCAIYRIHLQNPTEIPQSLRLLAAQQNAVGYVGDAPIEGRQHPGYGKNRNRIRKDSFGPVLHMTTDQAAEEPGYGDMALAMLEPEALGTASWDTLEALHATMKTGRGWKDMPLEAGPSEAGSTFDGALGTAFTLPPHVEKTVTIVLTWHFPNVQHGLADSAWERAGNKYSTWWLNALEVVREVAERQDALYLATSNYHKSLYETNLPHWLLDRISSQVAVLRSRTCFWAADGYFGAWEGCGEAVGCCQGNCSHVWHYAQAHARLFPELGRQMRAQALGEDNMMEDGAIRFRQYLGMIAVDGQAGEILGAYREYLCSQDGAWLAHLWPQVERAMEYMIQTWDPDEDGVLAGEQHNTLDTELEGSSTWLGALYLAALAACNRMARLQGKTALAERYQGIFQRGCATQDATLFNGEYYTQIPGATPRFDYNNGCHIDQVLGQWWAHQLDLDRLYPADHVRSALRAILKYNFQDNFEELRQYPRQFVADFDPGVQMITWPEDDRPDPYTLYADEVMSGFEYSAAAAMIQEGLIAEGFTILHAIAERYDGRLRTGLTPGDTASWGYSGNPFGDDECGKFYARAMSVWSVLLAAQGFLYDGPACRIGFRPVWRPEQHRSFFSTAAGWGVFRQAREAARQVAELHVRYGELRISEVLLALPEAQLASEVQVHCCGAAQVAKHAQKGGDLQVQFEQPILLRAGEHMQITVDIA